MASPDLHGRVQEQRTEDEEGASEAGDRLGADEDEDAAQHQGDDDPDQEHTVTLLGRDRERRDDHHEDKEVVDREGVLGDVAGEELAGVRRAEIPEHEAREGEGQGDVEDHPAGGLTRSEDVRSAVDKHEIQHDDRDQSRSEVVDEVIAEQDQAD